MRLGFVLQYHERMIPFKEQKLERLNDFSYYSIKHLKIREES